MTAPIRSRAGQRPVSSPGSAAPLHNRSAPCAPLRLFDRRGWARRRSRACARLAGAAAIAAILTVVFGLVAVHVLLAQNQFELDRLNARSSAEEAQYDRLRLEVAQLESPERVVATAEGRLGMVQPPKITYLTPKAAAPLAGAATGTASGTASGTTSASGAASAGSKATAAPAVAADWARVKAQLGDRP